MPIVKPLRYVRTTGNTVGFSELQSGEQYAGTKINVDSTGTSYTATDVQQLLTQTDTKLTARELTANKGIANGYASLDSGGKVPSNQLPSFVDDVLEYANLAGFPVTGETGKIYVALDTNKTYRWSGSAYIYITSGAVDSVFGRTGVVTAQSGDYTWAQINKTTSSLVDITTRNHSDLSGAGTNTHAQIDTHIANTSNPHGVTAAQVGAYTTAATDTLLNAKVTGPASATDNAVVRYDGTTGKLVQDSGVFITDSNNVGIGTASPLGLLHVSGTTPMYYDRYGSTAANFVVRSARGTTSTPTAVLSGEVVGSLSFDSYNGTDFSNAAYIRSIASENHAVGARGNYISIANIANGSNSPTERVRIDQNGAVGIGSTSLTQYSLRVGKTITGATTSASVSSEGAIQSDVTTTARYFQTVATTQAAAFTLTNLVHYGAIQSTIGATSAITNQYGFFVDTTLTGATNNYGFHSNIASGSNRWNFYANGTAANYFAGSTQIGHTTTLSSATSVSPLLQTASTLSAMGGMLMANFTNDSSGPGVYSIKSRGGSVGNYGSAVIAGDNLYALIAEGSDGVSQGRRGASIIIRASETFSPTTSAANITFNTTPTGSTSTSERMRIDSTGAVLIGTTTESARLTVRGAGATSATHTATFENSAGTDILVVRDDGNVGIGTASPSQKLHVATGGALFNGATSVQNGRFIVGDLGFSGMYAESGAEFHKYVTTSGLFGCGIVVNSGYAGYTANNTTYSGIFLDNGSFPLDVGSFTGLNWYGININGDQIDKSGTGTFSNAYGLKIAAPTGLSATTTYAAHFSGAPVYSTHQIVSGLATGTAPLSVASTTRVANLNVATAGKLTDTNNANALDVVTTASAVNYATVTNASTGNSVTYGVSGSDANVNLRLAPKSNGSINLDASAGTGHVTISAGTGEVRLYDTDSTHYWTFGRSNISANYTLTLPTSNGTLVTTGDTGTVTGTMIAGTTITNSNVSTTAAISYSKLAAGTANRAVAFDASGFITSTSTTSTELGYLSGVTSAIQGQLNTKEQSQLKGVATVDFGATSSDSTSVLVTGLTGLTSNDYINVFVQRSDTTVDNTADDHALLAQWGIVYGEYVSSTSIRVYCDLQVGLARGTFKIRYNISK